MSDAEVKWVAPVLLFLKGKGASGILSISISDGHGCVPWGFGLGRATSPAFQALNGFGRDPVWLEQTSVSCCWESFMTNIWKFDEIWTIFTHHCFQSSVKQGTSYVAPQFFLGRSREPAPVRENASRRPGSKSFSKCDLTWMTKYGIEASKMWDMWVATSKFNRTWLVHMSFFSLKRCWISAGSCDLWVTRGMGPEVNQNSISCWKKIPKWQWKILVLRYLSRREIKGSKDNEGI